MCAADRIDETVTAAHVFDGDTLRLDDGRKLRLLGVDTPEVGRDGAPSQPLAEAARETLEDLAGPGTRLRLRTDLVRRDRYGRLLAHAFREDGTNVQARLLAAGLATALVVPPNAWAHECYADVEAGARRRREGLWALPRYQAVPARSLPMTARGFRLVRGHVQRVGESRHNLWLDLGAHVSLRVPKADLVHFPEPPSARLVGRAVEARGWLYRRHGQLRITLRHPAALTLLD